MGFCHFGSLRPFTLLFMVGTVRQPRSGQGCFIAFPDDAIEQSHFFHETDSSSRWRPYGADIRRFVVNGQVTHIAKLDFLSNSLPPLRILSRSHAHVSAPVAPPPLVRPMLERIVAVMGDRSRQATFLPAARHLALPPRGLMARRSIDNPPPTFDCFATKRATRGAIARQGVASVVGVFRE